VSAAAERLEGLDRDPVAFRWQGTGITPPWPRERDRPAGRVVLDEWFPPVINQGMVPLCTAAVVTALAAYFARRARQAEIEPSILFNYRMARRLMGQPDRRGAHIDSSIAAWRRFGLPDEASWPWTAATVDTDPETGLRPAAHCTSDVVSWRIRRAELTPERYIGTLRAAMRAGLPVACELPLYTSQFSSFATGAIPLPGEGERSLGMHITLLVGFDDTGRHFRVRNSWGEEWGDRGYGALPYAYFERELAGDSWLVVERDWIVSTEENMDGE
jgi:C1A family cysteine protease